MDIQISSQREIPWLDRQKIRRDLERVLKDLACHDKELSILLADDNEVALLNNQYLGRTGPTNVLAFPMSGGPAPEIESAMLGDVVISIDRALRESEELGETPAHAVYRLLIHGVLHLLGYDHEESSYEAGRMEKEEDRLIMLIREE